MVKPHQPSWIPIGQILSDALDKYKSAKIWAGHGNWDIAARQKVEAIALLELVEGFVCGSYGGFDIVTGKSQHNIPKYCSIEGRIKWLTDIRGYKLPTSKT